MTEPDTHQATEEQPARADATVDLTRRYCYRLDRTDKTPPVTLSWGAWEQAPAPMTTAQHAATYEAARVRLEHAYYGPLRVWVWQARPDEHWRKAPPEDAYRLDLGQHAAWKCVECGYEDTERSLICPNCATDGELLADQNDTTEGN